MFYSQFILAKKGPLGTIWIAAHLERKLRKNQVADTDIGVSVDSILFPEMPIALRLSSHLLLGVVRIYSRKVNYLFDDCSEALLKVKQAFRSTAVDLPPEESTAPYHSITLPETFDLDDFELPDSEIFQGNYVDHHVSSKDQITLQDTMDGVVYSTSKFGLNERFGDGDAAGLDLEEDLLAEKPANAEHATGTSNSGVDPQASSHADASFKYTNNLDGLAVPDVVPASDTANEDMDDYDEDNEPAEYAQAPCTPGLWEEPNLSNVQETSVFDDHQEPENHSIPESAVKESTSHEHHNLFEPHEKSPPHSAATERMLMDDLGSAPFTEPLLAEPEAVNAVSDDPNKMEELLNKNAIDVQPGVQIVDDNDKNIAELQGTLNTEPTLEPKNSTISVQSPQYSMQNSVFPTLRPCVTLLNHETNGEASLATGGLDMNVPQDQLTEIGQNDGFRVDNATDREVQVDNINSYTTNFPAPVKLLSSPPGFSDIRKEMVPENTPTEKDDMRATVGLDMNFPQGQLTEIGQNDEMRVYTATQREVQVGNINSYTTDMNFPQGHATQREVQVGNINSYTTDMNFPQGQRTEIGQNDEMRVYNATQREVQVGNISSYTTDMNFPQGQRTEIGQNDEMRAYNATQREVQVGNINSYTTDFPAPEKLRSLPPGFSDIRNEMLPESTPAERDTFSGQKRSFNESSLTDHGMSLVESSGPFTTNVSGKSVVNDDDLLSSILVGRNSSILKLKPTPPVEAPSAKRRRAAPKTPKTGVLKRKVVMDDNMVLHGDTIRQQLINTEDIRRLRKKAPCTRSEISMLKKQFWEDELFSESIFTGVSAKLTSLHNQLYDLSKIVVAHYDASLGGGTDPKPVSYDAEQVMQLEVGPKVPQENIGAYNSGPIVMKDVSEAQPSEFSLVTDSHTYNNATNFGYRGSEAQMHATGDVTEPHRSEQDLTGQATAMEIDARSFSDAIPIEVHSLAHANDVPVNTYEMSAPHANEVPVNTYDMSAPHANEVPVNTYDMSAPKGAVENISLSDASVQTNAPDIYSLAHGTEVPVNTYDMSAPLRDVENTTLVDASVQTNAPDIHSLAHANEVPINNYDMSAPMGDVENTSLVDASVQTNAPDIHSNENMDLQMAGTDPFIGSNIASELKVASVTENSEEKHDQDTDFRKNEEQAVNEDAAFTQNDESNAHNLLYNGIFGEDYAAVGAYDTEVNAVVEDVQLDERENQGHHVTFQTDVEDIPPDNKVDNEEQEQEQELAHSAVGNDTEFLNFDDDNDDAGDYAPDVEATRVIDNSGWSSRTKAVAKYLQIMFDKEGERGRNMIPVNNLLIGKTRKEASRMFFETLVLKTKDYIHVEQADPYDNINVFPRAKLLKSDF